MKDSESMTWNEIGITVPQSATGNYQTTCPKCSPHRKKKKGKCLSVNIETELFNCHHCGWGGSLKTGENSASKPYHWRQDFTKPDFKKRNLPEKVITWFREKRGIDHDTLVIFDINYNEHVWMPQVEDFVSAIEFPFKENGEVVNIKFRDGKKNFRQVANAKKIMYNVDDLKKVDYILITEGEIDAMSFHVAGVKAISIPDGAPAIGTKNYESKFDYLDTISKQLETCKKVVIAVDTDEPGQKLEYELSRRIGREKCWKIIYPDDCKDANDVLVKHGKEILSECFDNATPYPVEGIITVSEIKYNLLHIYEHGYRKAESTGWPCLDPYYNVRPGEFTIVTGVPSHGKSSFCDNLMVNLAKRSEWRWAIFSPENLPHERHLSSLAEIYSGRPFSKGPTKRMSEEELEESIEWMKDHFFFIFPEDDDTKLDNLISLAKVTILRYGVKGILFDPWNEIDHSRPGSISETDFVSRSLSKIRRLSRTHDVHVFLVVHPTKLPKQIDDDGNIFYPVPTLYDCSGSANFYNKADCGLSIWRNPIKKDGKTKVYIQKIKFHEIGDVGEVDLWYDRTTRIFNELPISHAEPPRVSYKDAAAGNGSYERPVFDNENLSNTEDLPF